MRIRFIHRAAGGHVYVKVFAGSALTYGKAGDLTFRKEEWDEMKALFSSLLPPNMVSFMEEFPESA